MATGTAAISATPATDGQRAGHPPAASSFPDRRIEPRLLIWAGTLVVGLCTRTASDALPHHPLPTRACSGPLDIYLQGYSCLTLIVGVDRSTDNQTPQSQLTYDVFADGRRIGSMADLGSASGVWSIQHLTHTGPNTITVKAADTAGNQSPPSTGPSTTNVAPGHPR